MSWAEATDPAAAYARMLLTRHGIAADIEDERPRSAAAEWADSGAMELTGTADGAPSLVTGAPATTMRGALLALSALARVAGRDPTALPDARALSERAAYMGFRRNGRISAGGATRLLDAADGQVAVTLSRPDDVDALRALTGRDVDNADPWPGLADWIDHTPTTTVVERAALLGLAAGAVDPTVPDIAELPASCLTTPSSLADQILVVDLSALWAGPLCAHLLDRLGAKVVTVDSVRRPDPTRTVAPEFHKLLRGHSEHIALDLRTIDGVAKLTALVKRADVVIESTRPRALHQLGIDPAEIVATAKACSWVSITAYGRAHNRVGYGDDVAAAAGLLGAGPVFADSASSGAGFAGDAIADPLTGAHAAVAALAGVLTGQAAVLDIAMYDVARAARTAAPVAEVVLHDGKWLVDDGRELTAVRSPATRAA